MDDAKTCLKILMAHASTISILGDAKHAGKSTCLLHLLRAASALACPVAVTSIGIDGEGSDVYDGRSKPRLYLKAGSLVASASSRLLRSDASLEFLDFTGTQTALGEVLIARLLSDGYVELAGPSTLEALRSLKVRIQSLAPKALFFVDGALSRHSHSRIAEASLLVLRAKARLEDFKDATEAIVSPLCAKTLEADAKEQIHPKAKLQFFDLEGHLLLALEGLLTAQEILGKIPKDSHSLLLRGALSTALLEGLTRSNIRRILLEDGACVLANGRALRQFKALGGNLRLLTASPIRALAFNPSLEGGGSVSEGPYLEILQAQSGLPVFSLGPYEEVSCTA